MKTEGSLYHNSVPSLKMNFVLIFVSLKKFKANSHSGTQFENLNFHVINIKAGIGIYSSSKKTEKFVYIYMTPQNHNIFCFGNRCVTYMERKEPYDYSLLDIVP